MSKNSHDAILNAYLQIIHQAQQIFEDSVSPILDPFFSQYDDFIQAVENRELNINYNNPMIHTQKVEYFLYMLLIEYSNQLMKSAFDNAPKKIVLLPRCITGPNYDLLKVKRTKVGWHKIVACKDNIECDGWMLSTLGKEYGFEVYITMGSRFREPSFLKVFKNLRHKFGMFGLIAVACVPELALGRTYIMEMGIPTQAVPLFYSGCDKWHGPKNALVTKFPLQHVLNLLKISQNI